MQAELKFAKQTALEAGELLRGLYEKKGLGVTHKGRIDLVTEADVKAEQLITSAIRKEFPNHGILAEEGTEENSGAELRWIIDPLDGTTNFAHGFPFFAVSIALCKGKEPLIGVVCEPMRNELFWASKGNGAYLNGHRISVSTAPTLQEALVATGFPYDINSNERNNLDNFRRVALQAQAVRRPGAAAIDLAYTACGRLDGFWELRLKAWDMAAGALLVTEAGGLITDMTGAPLDLFNEHLCAANRMLHPQLLALLNA